MQGRWFKAGWLALCLAVSVPALATTYTVFPDGSGCTMTEALTAINTQTDQHPDPANPGKFLCPAGSGNDIINLLSPDAAYYTAYRVAGVAASADQVAVAKWMSTFTNLAAYQAADVYQLPQQMEVGGAFSSSLTIQLFRGVFDKAVYDNAIVKAASNNRAFFVHTGSRLTLTSIALSGSDVTAQASAISATPPTSPNGGVIYAQGDTTLTAGSTITGGQAQNGGGIYLDGTNLTFSFANAFISGNTATSNGGGVGVADGSTLIITGSQFNLFSNSATNGGAIYLGGQTALLTLKSGTLYNNQATGDGSAIDFAAGYVPGTARSSSLNNLTVIDNTGAPALHYWDVCQQPDTSVTPTACKPGGYAPPGALNSVPTWVPGVAPDGTVNNPPGDKRTDFLYNSVVVGNATAGCAMTFDGSNTTSSLSQYLQNVYSVTSDAGAGSTVGQTIGCPAAEQMLQPGNGDGTTNPANPANNATVAVLSGAMTDGSSCVLGTAGCSLRDFGKQHYYLQGALPTSFDVNSPVYPTLVNAGSPDTATTQYLCNSTDERSETRADTCDVGALELTIAAGATDDFDTVVTGQTVWLDIVKNDLGDESIDCTRVHDDTTAPTLLTPCIGQPAPTLTSPALLASPLITQYGGSAVVVYAAGPLPDQTDGTPVYFTTTDPGTQATADAAHPYPLIRYVSAPGFHGEDTFLYQVPVAAILGATYAGKPLSAQVNMAVAPVDNFPNKNITDYRMGGVGVWMLLGLLVLGLSRKKWQHKTVLASLLLVGVSAQANTITVNDLSDPTNLSQYNAVTNPTGAFNDGKCTLREALQRTFDNYPVADNDCAPGAPGTDTIVLPAGTITLQSPLAIGTNNSVIIQGAGVNKTFIDGAGLYRISTQSPLTLQYLTFQNGAATDPSPGQGQQGGAIFTSSDLGLDHVAIINSVATDAGGAIFLSYGTNVGHSLSIASSYIKGNQAASGGAIFTVGQNQQLQLSIDSSTFASNIATSGKGGAIDANLAQGGALGITNSIFTANVSPVSSAAIDLSDANPSTTINILNSTFYNNTGGSFLDSGNNSTVVLSNSIVAGNTISCSSGTGLLKSDNYNLYTPSEPASCGASSSAMPAPLTAVTTALNNGVLTPATGSTSDYLPPLFTVIPTSPIIVNKGYPGGLASGVFSPVYCRTVDMRGKSRLAGGNCDIGAFEVQIITALDDAVTTNASTSNGTSAIDRQARVDVLTNDLPSDGATIDTDTIGFLTNTGSTKLPADGTSVQLSDLLAGNYTYGAQTLALLAVTPAGVPGTLTWVQKKTGDPVCASGDDCGLLFDFTCDNLATATGFSDCTALQTALSADIAAQNPVPSATPVTTTSAAFISAHDPNNLICPNGSTPPIKIPYVAYDSNGYIANATLSVTLKDIPPQFTQGTINVYTNPDQDVSIPLSLTDPDGVVTAIGLAQNGDPEFAKETGTLDPNNPAFHPSWGVGVIWNGSLTSPVITYKHANATQVFDDSFKIQATDNCGGVSTVTININFPQTGDNGSSLLHGGSLGWGLGLLLFLGLTRRRCVV